MEAGPSMLTWASPAGSDGAGAGADRAKARYGVIDNRSGKSAALTEEALALARAAAAAALNGHRNLAALTDIVAISRAREARRFPGALRRSDLLEPPGRRCGCWRRRHLRFSKIVGWQILVRGRRWSSGDRC